LFTRLVQHNVIQRKLKSDVFNCHSELATLAVIKLYNVLQIVNFSRSLFVCFPSILFITTKLWS